MSSTSWLIAIALAYLCGSVPFGFLIGRARGVDLRKVGSGNIGATNCGRVLGRGWGWACLVLDFLKGFVPVFAAGVWAGLLGLAIITPAQAGWWMLTAVAAVLGHVFPIWLGFKGGKGVATAFGVLVGVWPVLSLTAAVGILIWLTVVATTRFVSLGSIAATWCMCWWALIIARSFGMSLEASGPFVGLTAALAVLVLIRHRSNLARVLAGTENRVGRRR